MSEKYISLQSFKYGLDARRDQLSTVPGTLVAIQNAFINAGGEIEQRQSFVKDGTLFPTNCFGLQDTDTGLMTFGVDAAPNGALPTGIVYQQLPLPAGVGSQISKIVFSSNYLGKAFVIVLFDNSVNNFIYYNGVIVGSSRNGLVLPGAGLGGAVETPTMLAQDLADQINALNGWEATANFALIGGVAVATPGAVIVKSPPGIHFNPGITVDTVAGQLSATLVDQNVDSTPASSASTIFTINAGGAGDTINLTAPTTAAGTGSISLTGGTIPFNTSLAQTAADIVSRVNLLTGSTGYTAAKTGATITVFSPSAFGNFTFNLTVITTGTMTTFAGGGGTALFTGHLTNTGISPVGGNLMLLQVSFTPIIMSGSVSVSYTGAAGSVTTTWSEVDSFGNPAANSSGIAMSTTSGSKCGFSALVVPGSQTVANDKHGWFKIVALDNGSGTTKSVIFTVRFSLVLA